YRDLPLLINQWANVMRWEKRPRLFLRTTEFLWQEGHTAHATHDEAEERTLQMLEVYRSFLEEDMAIPVVPGRKRESQKFAGVRVKVDASEQKSPGWKFNEWELKGVPLRVEIGPRDVQNNSVVLVRRDNRAKEPVGVDTLAERVRELLADIQASLFRRAVEF